MDKWQLYDPLALVQDVAAVAVALYESDEVYWPFVGKGQELEALRALARKTVVRQLLVALRAGQKDSI